MLEYILGQSRSGMRRQASCLEDAATSSTRQCPTRICESEAL